MKKWIVSLTLLLCVFSVTSCCTVSDSRQYDKNIVVQQKLTNDLRKYKTFSIGSVIGGSRYSGYDTDISIALSHLGLKSDYSGHGRLFVECIIQYLYGLPRIGRNFYWHWKYLGMLNVKITDVSNNEVIGEVEYNRPWASLPPVNVETLMIKKLMESYVNNLASSNVAESSTSLPKDSDAKH